ncbi:hypothetical protein B0H14DRAFT_3645262 [Mycena olivaceomarginata]|nr:hypothetical protein B0H14DRAFT_3645262 [Mycena olivaceomarginata]
MNTATISLHRQNALIKFRELKKLVSIMKRTITLLRKVLVMVMRPDSYPLPPSSRPAPASVLTTFPAAMDEWQCSQPYWDGSSEAQRRQPPRASSAPAAGVLPSFGFPNFGHPTPLLFPGYCGDNSFVICFPGGASQPAFHSDFSLPASWDAEPFKSPVGSLRQRCSARVKCKTTPKLAGLLRTPTQGAVRFYHSLQSWRCNGIRTDGARCDGSISLRKLNTPDRNKNHILLCSKRSDALTTGSLHSQARISDHISEELFVKVMNGEPIIEEDDTNGTCSRVVSGRAGAKWKSQCRFNHRKNGLPYVAKVQPVTCIAKMHIYCPWKTLHPELARMAVVVPFSESGHTHPPPPNNKCTHAIAERYRECVRKIGFGATVAKVENGTTYFFTACSNDQGPADGKTPSLFHPGLISRDTKTRLIQQVKAELNEVSATTTNMGQQVAIYLADQEALRDEKRYLHSSLSRDGKRIIFGAHDKLLCSIHDLRTLDCDTTFKPVAGEMQIFEINGWLTGINECFNADTIVAVTVMRIWMEIHDRKAYKTVWEEVQRLVLKLGKISSSRGFTRGGEILGLNSDMEAAPLLRFADAFVGTVDLEDLHSVVGSDPQKLLSFVLRICYSHFNRGIPKLLHLPDTTRKRILDLKYAKTFEEVEAFKAWILTVLDPHGVLKRWWDHKLMHRWLLRGIIHCLSNIPLDQWNTKEATTNLGEAQHAWNNAQTGISMGVIESFKSCERRIESDLDMKNSTSGELKRSKFASRLRFHEKRYHNVTLTGPRGRPETPTRQDELALRTLTSPPWRWSCRKREKNSQPPAGTLTPSRRPKLLGAFSSSSGRVRAPRASASAAISNTTSQPASCSGPALAPGAIAAPLTISSVATDAMDSDVAGGRRGSARKRAQADLSGAAPASSNKRQKKLEDPLAGWVMQDPDTGEKLTGHEWVKRYQ